MLADCEGTPEIILIGTGSELPLVVAAHEKLTAEGVRSRVVSLPSLYLFEKQDDAYRESVFPNAVRARLAVEQAGALRLGPLCRPRWRHDHHVDLRRLRPARQAAGEIRLHGRTTSATSPAS